ncbi:COX15/CtaA family protein [Pontibacter burrus]|uniref:Heme A synthase n=1 Tax=Pontibacter burrus TaxID=2704466 RepID=A0A6B3LUF1_9BACT|nr:COX15/CtaA family protein [Pontibacter burrus]NEM97130.1 heme A synthase [Pontibacter burrus]
MQQHTYNKAMVWWLASGIVLILAMVVVGGITRLTGSGLSIVEWNLLSGTLPPLTEAAWAVAFEKYKQFPEYQKLNYSMTLEGFKQIFWWEYLHRLLGRVIGVVFIVPFLYFWASKQLTGRLLKRLLFILLLGMTQGLMGWVMVKSGLVDNPHVSHYRLAAHLLLAVALISTILWTIADLVTVQTSESNYSSGLKRLSVLVVSVLLVQLVLGAFVAGLKAGFSYNTYPLMNGELLPFFLRDHLTWANFLENGVFVQFLHRWFAMVVVVVVLAIWFKVRRVQLSSATKTIAILLVFITFLQVGSGIVTLLFAVPVSLGVLHQVMAIVLFGLGILLLHQLQSRSTRFV